MANIKDKVKNFWDNHKTDVYIVGGIATTTIVFGACALKCYASGFNWGVGVGFYEAIDFFDKTFPEECKTKELYEAWLKDHPNETSWVNVFGNIKPN